MTKLIVNGHSSVQVGTVQTAEKAAGLMEDIREQLRAQAEEIKQLRKENVQLRTQLNTQDSLFEAQLRAESGRTADLERRMKLIEFLFDRHSHGREGPIPSHQGCPLTNLPYVQLSDWDTLFPQYSAK